MNNILTQIKHEYSLINLSNVLKYVLDPINILEKLKLLLSLSRLLRISILNDFSKFQKFLLAQQQTTEGIFANKSRIEIDSFLFLQGIKNYTSYHKASVTSRLNRQVLIYAQKRSKKNENR